MPILDAPLEDDLEGTQFFAALDALKQHHGKPVVIVTYGACPPKNNGGSNRWAIAGDLMGSNPAGCGSGFQVSMLEAVEAVKRRAERAGWSDTDYILLIDRI